MQYMKNLPPWSNKIYKIVLSVLIIILIGYLSMNAKINEDNHSGEAEAIPSSEKYYEKDNENNDNDERNNDIVWDDDETIFENKDIVNILLIGQDKRSGETRARSDSMIVASINKNSKTIKLISLMRDMYVQIPGYSDNKLNTAYALGGKDLLNETIEKNFSISIDGNVEVDFEGFTKVVDKIGGVKIELNESETYYLNKTNNLNLSSGENHLTGDVALQYSRIRYIGNDDYERTQRQRNVLVAAFNKLKDLNLKILIGLADEIIPLISTDLSTTEIIALITKAILWDVSKIETYRIPADGEFTVTSINGMSVLVPKLSENRLLLKEYMGY
ncbi:LCP family protein [Sedimentibacter sp. MB31-C6]|uniref:LCP family protein n=1 Tax=Sedimentibacter sp. MB31-C6 TaxID=3109366 RepID=UPI002DDD977E|nr:LCP family protein [Sedimentibacter sp. MB36-C1]WSI03551.1 LCP family protein [Sedimentibacter sp. MB36-C1]